MWVDTKDTVVEIGTVASGSALHRYLTIMYRAALLLGVRDGSKPHVQQVKISPASVTSSGKTQIDLKVWHQTALKNGELHPVGRPHVDSDRQLWIRWDDVPQTFKENYDYITPKQNQLLHTLREKSRQDAQTKMDKLLKEFRDHVRADYTKGEITIDLLKM